MGRLRASGRLCQQRSVPLPNRLVAGREAHPYSRLQRAHDLSDCRDFGGGRFGAHLEDA